MGLLLREDGRTPSKKDDSITQFSVEVHLM
jgi:hypothetical protein